MSYELFIQELSHYPEFFGWHMILTVAALAIGISLSIPLAVLSGRYRSLQTPLLSVASVIQTVPSLALLALMVLLLGGLIGILPALIALTLYSLLPVLRNTVTGIAEVDPAMIEAARGMGMTDNQMLFKVQLPLAAPVIIAGIRTATVWVVGIATLSTPVGATSLGNYIFRGLQTQNWTAVWIGVVAAAALALVFDGLIRLMEIASIRRNKPLGAAAGIVLGLIVLAGTLPILAPGLMRDDRPRVWVGAKTFTEQYILAEVLADRLAEAGYNVRKTEGMGSTILFNALAAGSVDAYVDYSGTIWATIMEREGSAPAEVVMQEMARWLEENYGVATVGALGFENAYALAMRRDRAEELGIRTIADLARHAAQMEIGGDYEFFGRPEWVAVRAAYGITFARERSMQDTFMYGAVRDGQVDVISAFSSDGRIAQYDLLVLEDPVQAIPPYDAVLLLSPRAAEDEQLIEALRPLVGAIDDDAMREANRLVDVENRPIRTAAEYLLDRIPNQVE